MQDNIGRESSKDVLYTEKEIKNGAFILMRRQKSI